MILQGQVAGDFDIIRDNVPLDRSIIIFNLPVLSGISKSARSFRAKAIFAILRGGVRQNVQRSSGLRPHRTHTFGTILTFASLPSDPESGGTTVYHNGKITRGGSDADGGNVSGIVGAAILSVEETTSATGGELSLHDTEPKRISRGGFFGLGETIGEVSGEVDRRETLAGCRLPATGLRAG